MEIEIFLFNQVLWLRRKSRKNAGDFILLAASVANDRARDTSYILRCRTIGFLADNALQVCVCYEEDQVKYLRSRLREIDHFWTWDRLPADQFSTDVVWSNHRATPIGL